MPAKVPSLFRKRRVNCTDHLLLARPMHRLADEEAVVGAVDVNLEVLAVADIDPSRGRRTGIRAAADALGVDDRHLNDDLAQHVRGVHDGLEVRRVLGRLDGAPEIQQGLVDLADRAQDVLFEQQRVVLIPQLDVAKIFLEIVLVGNENAGPQHDHDDQAPRAADGRRCKASLGRSRMWNFRLSKITLVPQPPSKRRA